MILGLIISSLIYYLGWHLWDLRREVVIAEMWNHLRFGYLSLMEIYRLDGDLDRKRVYFDPVCGVRHVSLSQIMEENMRKFMDEDKEDS